MNLESMLHWKYWAKRDGVSTTCMNITDYNYIQGIFKCSECKKELNVIDLEANEDLLVNYCPVCGAKVVE